MDRFVHACINGHTLISRTRLSENQFCEACGAKMIDTCQECGTAIKEWDFGGFPFIGDPDYERASYCKNCGKPYPWTKVALEAMADLIAEEAELNDMEREKLLSSLPDIITETPKTSVAVVRFKKAFLSAGKFTTDALRQFAIDFGCELAKSQLGL